jgi:hypothetical protein
MTSKGWTEGEIMGQNVKLDQNNHDYDSILRLCVKGWRLKCPSAICCYSLKIDEMKTKKRMIFHRKNSFM